MLTKNVSKIEILLLYLGRYCKETFTNNICVIHLRLRALILRKLLNFDGRMKVNCTNVANFQPTYIKFFTVCRNHRCCSDQCLWARLSLLIRAVKIAPLLA